MLRRVPRIAILLVALSLGCSEEPPPSGDGVGEEVVAPAPRERTVVESIYDGEGVPRESTERVAGLVLPRGLEEIEGLREERRHVYASDVPPQKLLRYFGPRLTTVDIRRQADTVTYRQAIPRGVRGGAVKLDVTVRPSSRRGTAAHVEIFERPPPPPEGVVISAEEIRRHFRDDARRE